VSEGESRDDAQGAPAIASAEAPLAAAPMRTEDRTRPELCITICQANVAHGKEAGHSTCHTSMFGGRTVEVGAIQTAR
jgi:hypothetical protein